MPFMFGRPSVLSIFSRIEQVVDFFQPLALERDIFRMNLDRLFLVGGIV